MSAQTRDDYIIMYLYERLLFIPVFHEIRIDGLDINDLKISTDLSHTIFDCPEAVLFNNIVDYICGHNQFAGARFYKDRIDIFESYNGQYGKFPLPYIIIKNYLGLSYLNYAEREKSPDEELLKADFLEKAYDCFCEVLDLANRFYSGSVTQSVLQSFAFYNRARVQCASKKEKYEWSADFEMAVRVRECMSKRKEFPDFIRLYFMNEMYHSVNGQIYAIIQWYDKEQTIVAGQSFFKTVKENSQRNLLRL